MAIVISGLFDYLSELVMLILMGLLYPFVAIFNAIHGIIYNVLSAIGGLFNSVHLLASALYIYFTSFLTIFPSIWSGIILTALTTIITLRIYNLIWGGNNG